MCNCSEVAKFNTEKSIQRQNVFNKNMQPQINRYYSSSLKHLTHKKRSTYEERSTYKNYSTYEKHSTYKKHSAHKNKL